jgi:hypothetical protein
VLTGEQLAFSFNRGLPVAVNRRAVRRFVSRSLRLFSNESAKSGFVLREYLEDVALLDQVRAGLRKQAREVKRQARSEGRRMKGLAAITCACNPEGRRAQRLIDRLSERIMEREPRLCA